jgi:hypothetical protein
MKYLKRPFLLIVLFLFAGMFFSFHAPTYKIAKMKYNGGGIGMQTGLPFLI